MEKGDVRYAKIFKRKHVVAGDNPPTHYSPSQEVGRKGEKKRREARLFTTSSSPIIFVSRRSCQGSFQAISANQIAGIF
jgi:hypothetical protein